MRLRLPPWLTILCVLELPAAPALAQSDPGALTTSRVHVLTVRPRTPAGIETDMPRSSIYGQAVALDVEERFEQSATRYRQAEAEFRSSDESLRPRRAAPAAGPPVSARPVSRPLVWAMKSRWQAMWSLQLATTTGRGLRPVTPSSTADLGQIYFLKFLAARAFTGRPPLRLARRARSLLEEALRQEPANAMARVNLATLLHEIGDANAALREFARVTLDSGPRDEPGMVLQLAGYHAAAGERRRAVELLERLLRQRPHFAYRDDSLRWSNTYDRLRDDPRFLRLLDGLPPSPRH
jgi:tetratricopeptide (TPR) repeat protein